jgi:hypothetical protein
MRSGQSVAIVLTTTWLFAGSFCSATSIPVGLPVALGPRAFAVEMDRNPELASFIERRGYPDWVERVEVDSGPPLDSYEVRVFYLRLDREIAFTRAFILDQPHAGLRKFDRPIAPAMREQIERYYLAQDPARRAELAAERAAEAAERAERGAAMAVDAADRTTRVAEEMDRSFRRRLRK